MHEWRAGRGSRLRVSGRCHVILDWHVALDKAREEARRGGAIGTTGRGIGPTYEDKEARRGIRVADLLDPASLEETIVRLAHEKNVVPIDLSVRAAAAPVLRSPAAAALDMDTHVAKHTLLIGDAGGFISAASNEGIYPAMWSARLAAKAAHSALKSTYSQDELMTFDSLWRMEMADHLRSPHTDIRFLLPLIFSNQPMADRMGAAFFCGDNI